LLFRCDYCSFIVVVDSVVVTFVVTHVAGGIVCSERCGGQGVTLFPRYCWKVRYYTFVVPITIDYYIVRFAVVIAVDLICCYCSWCYC